MSYSLLTVTMIPRFAEYHEYASPQIFKKVEDLTAKLQEATHMVWELEVEAQQLTHACHLLAALKQPVAMLKRPSYCHHTMFKAAHALWRKHFSIGGQAVISELFDAAVCTTQTLEYPDLNADSEDGSTFFTDSACVDAKPMVEGFPNITFEGNWTDVWRQHGYGVCEDGSSQLYLTVYTVRIASSDNE